jgi:hypothetical protein
MRQTVAVRIEDVHSVHPDHDSVTLTGWWSGWSGRCGRSVGLHQAGNCLRVSPYRSSIIRLISL